MTTAERELSFLFRASRQSRPVILLGAGASYRSGIPLSSEAVKKIARSSYARHVLGLELGLANPKPSDFLPYLYGQPWFVRDEDRFAENFPLAVQHFLVPQEFRREFLTEMVFPPNGINDGYLRLARLVMRHLCWTVLTTNFDDLIAQAFRGMAPHIREVVEINRTEGDLVRFNIYNRCQVVYLHGAVQYYRDKNLIDETKRLDEDVVRRLRPLICDSPLVVIGYRGGEPSIVEHLLDEGVSDAGGYRHGIYWCVLPNESLHPNVEALRRRLGSNFRTVQIDGFDELMMGLDEDLSEEVLYLGSAGPAATMLNPTRFDHTPMPDIPIGELDSDLLTTTMSQYCRRLRIPLPQGDDYWALLLEQELVAPGKDGYVPTRGGYLLFGHRVPERFPNARVAFTRQGKKRLVFEGNLTKQFREILDVLLSADVNPIVRVKMERSSEERPAFPSRAITELLVNLLVHRNYELPDISRIDHVPGVELSFLSPGGLPAAACRALCPEPDGAFRPVRTVTDVRNPVLADTFYGLGSMDKAGTGLADVEDLMREHGGSTRFTVESTNSALRASLFQPRQKTPGQAVATPVIKTEVYLTNLLPFAVMPPAVSMLPLTHWNSKKQPYLFEDERSSDLPIFIEHDRHIVTFADLTEFRTFAERRGDYHHMERIELDAFVAQPERRKVLVWLLGKHWERFLYRLSPQGLFVDRERRRAYFRLTDGKKTNTITYNSAKRRGVSREVVKRRTYRTWVEHENEGIAYWIAQYGDTWTVAIKPLYVFTQHDGRTPLSSNTQTRRSTQRMKFDRNPSVESDLVFWARILSDGQPVANLGGPGATNLLLDSAFCSAEVPEGIQETP